MTRKPEARPKKTQIVIDSRKIKGWSTAATKQYKLGFYAGREAGQGHGPIQKRGNLSDADIVSIVNKFWKDRKEAKKEFAEKPESYVQGWKDGYIPAVKLYSDTHRAQYRKERSSKRMDEYFVESDLSAEEIVTEEEAFDLPALDLHCDEQLSDEEPKSFTTPSISPLLRSPVMPQSNPIMSLKDLAAIASEPSAAIATTSTPQIEKVATTPIDSGIQKSVSPLLSNNFFSSAEFYNFKRLLQMKNKDEIVQSKKLAKK